VNRPLCFVLMPFGQKPDSGGALIDFDAVYRELIGPSIEQAEMQPLRADEEMTGGIIHKPMFERLILCEYAIADLTTANANVFYELGLRHAVRPSSTVLLFAQGSRLPFDVGLLRGLPYKLSSAGVPTDGESARRSLHQRLVEARQANTDSPVFQLVDWIGGPEIDHVKTDVFRDRVAYSEQMKDRLKRARNEGTATAVSTVEQELGTIADVESGVVIDLFLSYRAVRAWSEMIALVGKMSAPLAVAVMVQEQLALALNRNGDGERAEHVLRDLLHRRGPSSETYGLLGRVYKDRWDAAVKNADEILAPALLENAIDAYLHGFETDWRDAYPGVNAVTLMELRDPPDPRREQLIPVVTYAAERRIAAGSPDYWDHATLLELAVLAGDERRAFQTLSRAAASIREKWEPETTANNLRLIRAARERRGQPTAWLQRLEEALESRAIS
jgi:hypothetical protein